MKYSPVEVVKVRDYKRLREADFNFCADGEILLVQEI